MKLLIVININHNLTRNCNTAKVLTGIKAPFLENSWINTIQIFPPLNNYASSNISLFNIKIHENLNKYLSFELKVLWNSDDEQVIDFLNVTIEEEKENILQVSY